MSHNKLGLGCINLQGVSTTEAASGGLFLAAECKLRRRAGGGYSKISSYSAPATPRASQLAVSGPLPALAAGPHRCVARREHVGRLLSSTRLSRLVTAPSLKTEKKSIQTMPLQRKIWLCLPSVERGCCCDLKTSCQVLGWVVLILYSITAAFSIYQLASLPEYCNFKAKYGLDCDEANKIAGIQILQLAYEVGFVITAAIFLHGILKNKPRKLIPLICMMSFAIVLMTIAFILGSVFYWPLIFGLLLLALPIYCIICAVSLHNKMVEGTAALSQEAEVAVSPKHPDIDQEAEVAVSPKHPDIDQEAEVTVRLKHPDILE